MKKEELVKLGVDEAVAKQVIDSYNEEMKGYVPKDRFNEVNEANKQLKVQVSDRDKQLETLKKDVGDSEALKAKITELQDSNKKATEQYEQAIKQMKVDNAVEKALTGAKAKNIKAVKALLDLSEADVDDNGVIKGLDKQIKKLVEAEDTSFLFNVEKATEQTNSDGKPNAGVQGMNPITPDNSNNNNGSGSLGAMFAQRYSQSLATNNSLNNNTADGGNTSAQ